MCALFQQYTDLVTQIQSWQMSSMTTVSLLMEILMENFGFNWHFIEQYPCGWWDSDKILFLPFIFFFLHFIHNLPCIMYTLQYYVLCSPMNEFVRVPIVCIFVDLWLCMFFVANVMAVTFLALLSKYNVLYNLVTLNIYLWKQNKSDLLALLSVLPFSCISRWTIPCLSISFTVSAFFLCVYSCYIWICFLLFFLNLFYMKLLL